MSGANVGRTLLAGGYRNDVWKVRAGNAWVIEKHYAADGAEPNPMFPNLPDHEAAALRLLDGTGAAPRLISVRPSTAARPAQVVYQFVPGGPWRRGVAQVADLLHRVHTLRAPSEFRTLCCSAAEARAHADAMVHEVAVGDAATLVAVRPRSVMDDAVVRPALVHTDCGPGNIIRSPRGLVLIDWQCPGAGDAVEDLACFLSPAMMILYSCRPHGALARRCFLDSYADRATVARYRRDAAAWHYRIGAYCVWRADRLRDSQPDVALRYRRALAAEVELIVSLS